MTNIIARTRNGHTYLMTYPPGAEVEAALELWRWAKDPELNFTRRDYAELMQQIVFLKDAGDSDAATETFPEGSDQCDP